MRRFLFATGLLATLATAQADAGYFVVRIILESGGGGGGAAPGPGGVGEGGPPGLMQPPGTPGTPLGRPPGIGGPPPGGIGMPPGLGAPPAAGGGGDPNADPARSIFVVIPVTKSPDPKGSKFYPGLNESKTFNPIWPLVLKHSYGTTNLMVDGTQIQLYAEFAQTPAAGKTRTSLVQSQYDEWKRTKGDTQQLLTLMTDALAVGMVKQAGEMADEVLLAVAAKKATTPAVDRFVAAYTPLQKGLKARVPTLGDGPTWKGRLGLGFGDAAETTSAHYYLVSWGGQREDEARRRLDQLEENLQAFYLLHAARGVALPLPDRLLPVVLTGTGAEVRKLRDALDATAVVSDGFFAPEHDLLVLAPERIDEVGLTFQRQVNAYFRKGVNRIDLLHPENYTANHTIIKLNDDSNPNVKEGSKAADVARMMTWTMADAFNQHDSEIAAVTREGTRQLLYASGLLPKYVSAPAWLANGSADYLHRPRGAVFTDGPDGKTIATVGLTTGYGAPNFAQQKLFRDLVGSKLLPADPAVLLRNVVTDTYFAAVTARLDADDAKLPKPKAPPTGGPTAGGPPGIGVPPGIGGPPPGVGSPRPPGIGGPPPGIGMPPGIGGPPGVGAAPASAPVEDAVAYARRRQEFLTNKARSTSWALYHHLATNHPDALRRYFAELAKLPRDLPFDGTANLAVFMTAFNLTTTGEAGKVPFARFAAEWLDAVATQPQTGSDFPLQIAPPPAATTPGGPPGQPGGPPPGRG